MPTGFPYRRAATEGAQCPAIIGPHMDKNPCPEKAWKKIRRLLFVRQDWTNPFTGFTGAGSIDDEATFDAFYALGVADAPNNGFYTSRIFEQTVAEPVITTVDSNDQRTRVTGNIPFHEMTINFKDLDGLNEEVAYVSLNDNSNNLAVYFVTDNDQLISFDDGSGNPIPFPVQHAKFHEFAYDGTNLNNNAVITFDPEILIRRRTDQITTYSLVNKGS